VPPASRAEQGTHPGHQDDATAIEQAQDESVEQVWLGRDQREDPLRVGAAETEGIE